MQGEDLFFLKYLKLKLQVVSVKIRKIEKASHLSHLGIFCKFYSKNKSILFDSVSKKVNDLPAETSAEVVSETKTRDREILKLLYYR